MTDRAIVPPPLEQCLSERRNLEQIFHAVHDGIIAAARDGQILHANDVAQRLVGKSFETLDNRPISGVFKKCAPDLLPTLTQLLTTEGVGPVGQRVPWRHPSCGSLDITAFLSLLKDRSGTVEGVVLVLHDETELRRLRTDLNRNRGLTGVVGCGDRTP